MFRVMNEFKRTELPKQNISENINTTTVEENNTNTSNSGPQFFI